MVNHALSPSDRRRMYSLYPRPSRRNSSTPPEENLGADEAEDGLGRELAVELVGGVGENLPVDLVQAEVHHLAQGGARGELLLAGGVRDLANALLALGRGRDENARAAWGAGEGAARGRGERNAPERRRAGDIVGVSDGDATRATRVDTRPKGEPGTSRSTSRRTRVPSEISDRPPNNVDVGTPVCRIDALPPRVDRRERHTRDARTNPSIGRTPRALQPPPRWSIPLSRRDPPTTTRPEPSTSPTPTWKRSSSAVAPSTVCRLSPWRFARSRPTPRRVSTLSPTRTTTADPRRSSARVPPRPRARRPRATSRHPRTRSKTRAATDAALVAHHRRRQGDEPTAREATEDVARAAAILATVLEEAEEDGLFAPFRNSPAKAMSTESRARTGTGTGTGTGIGTGTKRDGDAFPHPSRVYRTGMRLAPRNLRRWKISDRARARRPSTFSAT